MKQTLSQYEAAAFLLEDEYANWSYNGALALIQFLDNIGADLGSEQELDRVALRCDFSEYKNAIEAAQEYGHKCSTEQEALEALNNETVVLEFEGGVIVSNY